MVTVIGMVTFLPQHLGSFLICEHSHQPNLSPTLPESGFKVFGGWRLNLNLVFIIAQAKQYLYHISLNLINKTFLNSKNNIP